MPRFSLREFSRPDYASSLPKKDPNNAIWPRISMLAKMLNEVPWFKKSAQDELSEQSAADMEGQPMPKPSEFLSAKQKDGSTLCAAEIFNNTWDWLAKRGCAAIVSPQLIERFAMSSARWIQCESITSELGFLAKHPTTGAAIQSPYVAIADKYMTQANRLWSEIYQIVRENCTGEYMGASPQDDVMERLLQARKGS